MRPKGKLFALLAIFAAIGLVTATGAFTSVQAERTVNVQVAGDSGALLAIEETAADQTGSAGYIDTSGSTIVIDITSVGDVNDEALTYINGTIQVTNNGPNPVDFWIGNATGSINFWNTTGSTDYNMSASHAELGNGESVVIDIKIDTRGSPDNFPSQITFHAEDNSGGSTNAPGNAFDPQA